VAEFSDTFRQNRRPASGGESQWQDSLNLLKLLQNDYRGTRHQLEQVNLRLADREALVSQHLQYAFLSSGCYSALSLVEYKTGNHINCMGNIILGGVSRPAKISGPVQIEVRCLGRFEARSAFGKIERWPSVKAKSIFQYLLVRSHEPTVKEALMEALWPEGSAQAAGNSLKAAVHSLRSILSELVTGAENPQLIIFSQGGYRINPEIDLWIDVEEFEKCCVAGRRLEKEHKIAEALLEFEHAAILYRGDYLEDEPYEEWTLLRREALKDSYLLVLSKLAACCLKTGDYENCIHYSQKILAKDPCREDAYRNLIFCFIKLGQRNRALRWYDICCRTIKAELDAVPEKETADLFQKLLKYEII
jgi:DNA-binding SARP family transcriptional activator